MVDLYKVLGVSEDASQADIKAAYRRQALKLHPDTNPDGGGRAAQSRFHELQEAYGVLRDQGRRSQYDRMRASGFGGGAAEFEQASSAEHGGSYGTPWGQPGVDSRDFDAAFDAWWKRMSEDFQEFEERQYQKERSSAERMARTAAWEWEKREAQANKVRTQKLKWRTEDARLQRHATILRRFWQTHSGFTLGDALVAGLFLAGTAGIALAWRAHIREGRQAQQAQQVEEQQQQGPARVPAAAAAMAAAAAAAAAQSSS